MKTVRSTLVVLSLLYLGAFLVVHRSQSLRRPAANMAYWYYSDSTFVEAVEFYGFWPLRRACYFIPGLDSRHYLERIPFDPPPYPADDV